MPTYRYTRSYYHDHDGQGPKNTVTFKARNDNQALKKAASKDEWNIRHGCVVINPILERGAMVRVRRVIFRKIKLIAEAATANVGEY